MNDQPDFSDEEAAQAEALIDGPMAACADAETKVQMLSGLIAEHAEVPRVYRTYRGGIEREMCR